MSTIEHTSPTTDFTSPLSGNVGAFVLELAAQLQPLDEVLEKYSVDKTLFQKLLANKTFREMVIEAERSFKAITNTAERIKIKSQLLIEMGLDEMFGIMVDPKLMASARVQAFTAIRTLTGLEKPEAAAPAQKFNLTINIPNVATGQPDIVEVTGIALDPDEEDDDEEEQTKEEDPEETPIGDPPSDEPVTYASVKAQFAAQIAQLGVGVATPIQIIGPKTP